MLYRLTDQAVSVLQVDGAGSPPANATTGSGMRAVAGIPMVVEGQLRL